MRNLIAAAALAIAAPLTAQATVIDFDGLDATALQPVPLSTFTEDGFTFQLNFYAPGSSGPAIFDTTVTGSALNGDSDLVPAAQGENGVGGNVLILQEAGSAIPDDNAGPGLIALTLVSGPDFRFVGASAVDDTWFKFGTDVDGVLGSLDLGSDNETGQITFASPSSLLTVGDSILLAYGGSGGIDSLVLAPVPLPAALPMLLGGVFGLGYLGRRRKAGA